MDANQVNQVIGDSIRILSVCLSNMDLKPYSLSFISRESNHQHAMNKVRVHFSIVTSRTASAVVCLPVDICGCLVHFPKLGPHSFSATDSNNRIYSEKLKYKSLYFTSEISICHLGASWDFFDSFSWLPDLMGGVGQKVSFWRKESNKISPKIPWSRCKMTV